MRVEPSDSNGIRKGFERFGHHIGVQDDDSKLAGSTGRLSRGKSSSTPPNFCPMASKAEPMPIWGATAFSKIRRISASVLRPCSAAHSLRARCVASGRFLTVTADMLSSPLTGSNDGNLLICHQVIGVRQVRSSKSCRERVLLGDFWNCCFARPVGRGNGLGRFKPWMAEFVRLGKNAFNAFNAFNASSAIKSKRGAPCQP